MLWTFYHEIAIGDYVIARRGRKTLAAVGKVMNPAVYMPGKNPHLASANYSHSNFLDVEWQLHPRDKGFPTVVFPMPTLGEFSEEQFHSALEGSGVPSPIEIPEPVIDQYTFGLEKYLEDFIVGNFSTIFKDELKIYEDENGNEGQQYYTEIGLIDILAVEPKSKSFVVIELKKGRTSDQVVGQILRYMGWVKKNIATNGQAVKGLVICQKPDDKLTYALSVTPNINVRYYSVSFKLSEIS